jgi:hypothetical protein
MHTPTTTATPTPPSAPAAGRTWFYYVVYTGSGGFVGSAEVPTIGPLTHNAQVMEIQTGMAQSLGKPASQLVITSWQLLRVEDEHGRVIG